MNGIDMFRQAHTYQSFLFLEWDVYLDLTFRLHLGHSFDVHLGRAWGLRALLCSGEMHMFLRDAYVLARSADVQLLRKLILILVVADRSSQCRAWGMAQCLVVCRCCAQQSMVCGWARNAVHWEAKGKRSPAGNLWCDDSESCPLNKAWSVDG